LTKNNLYNNMKFDISYEGKKYPKIILKREVGW
jgi:hypothetical protein